MPETVTGSDLRAKADGLKTVIEGDAKIFDRDALRSIVETVKQDLVNAANTLEAHELHRRQTEQPQGAGAGSGQPTNRPAPLGPDGTVAGPQVHAAGTAPSHQTGDDRAPSTNMPPQQAEAAADQDRHEKVRASKDKTER